MATITSLSTLAKTSVGANDYLLVANGVTPANNKFLLQDLFPTVNTLGTSSEALFVSTTNKNTLNFKGIKSLNTLLTVATASNNITLQVNEANINLANCNNATAGFLSTVALASNVSGVLPIANGGTGLSTLSTSSFLYSNSSGAMTALPFGTNGQIVVGRTGLAPVLANLTAGTNVTITNGSGTITIAASLSTFTSAVNAAGYNFYGYGWLSPDSSNRGIKMGSGGQAFIGSGTPTPFYSGDLNVANSIYLNGNINQTIGSILTSTATPGALNIRAANANSSTVGGNLNIYAGNSQGSANAGGDINYLPGNHDGTGKSGNHVFWGYNTAATAQVIMTIDGDDKYIGINTTTPSSPLDVKQESTTANAPVIRIQQLDTDESFINFVGTSGAASANSISSSTASAASKTGAIRVKINGTDAWIRVYATAE
jgi:hypothetical protein